jgi:hypothetical protein
MKQPGFCDNHRRSAAGDSLIFLEKDIGIDLRIQCSARDSRSCTDGRKKSLSSGLYKYSISWFQIFNVPPENRTFPDFLYSPETARPAGGCFLARLLQEIRSCSD